MRIPDPKANTTTEAYLAYKAGYLEENELKPVLYEPYLHFDGWLAYWAGLTETYPNKGPGKNQMPQATANMTASGGRQTQFYMSLPAGTYTISFDLDNIEFGTGSSFSISMGIFGAGGTQIADVSLISIISSTTPGRKYKTFTISSDGTTDNRDNIRIPATDWNNGARAMLSNIQIEAGSTATEYEPYTIIPEMLTDEEALVAYLAGVTDTYPEEIKDPYDVRIVGYLKYLVSARWGRPDYPVNNEEFYLSTMKPPVVPSGDTPSSDIEMDDTAEAPFIDLKMYGDTSQQTYSGKNKVIIAPSTKTSQGVDWVITDTMITGSGTGTTNWSLITDYISFVTPLSEGQYTFSLPQAVGKIFQLNIRDTDGVTHDYSIEAGNTTITFTASYTASAYRFAYRTDQGAVSVSIPNKVQLEAGSTATSYEPYVGGVPAPNPDYPQDLNVVTGRQVVGVKGKNLFSTDDPIDASSSTTVIGSNSIYLEKPDTRTAMFLVRPRLPAGTYTVSYEVAKGPTNTEGCRSNISQKNGSATTIIASSTKYDGAVSYTFTATDEVDRIYFFIAGAQPDGATATITNIQIEEGDTATGFSKYKAPASYEINLGKNLFTFGYGSGKFQGITWTRNGDTAVGVGTATGSYTDTGTRIDLPVPLKAGQDYVFSIPAPVSFGCSLYLFDKNDQVISPSAKINVGETSVVFNKEVDIYKARITLSDYGGAGKELNIELRAQIELGSTATGYAPQFEPIELCKIGDYQDYIYRDEDGDWYVHKEVGKVIFTGTENWTLASTYTNNKRFVCQDIVTSSDDNTVLSNYFTQGVGGSDTENVAINNVSRKIMLTISNSKVSDLANFKTWLSSNKPTVCYILATPTNTQITNSELISQLDALMEGGSYEGKTYIKVTATDPNLPGLLYVEAGKYD